MIEQYHNPHTIFPRDLIDLTLDMINFKIHEEKNNKKIKRNRFITIYFQGKEIEKLNISHILHTYANLLPTQLVDKEIPTILYKRTKNIGSTLFNYKNTVNNVNTEEWLKQKHSCSCAESEFCDPEHKHIVSGDLRLIRIINCDRCYAKVLSIEKRGK